MATTPSFLARLRGRSAKTRSGPALAKNAEQLKGTLIARGLTNVEIAERLVLSVKTVQNHVSNIFGKLQIADRAQAAIRARDAGLV